MDIPLIIEAILEEYQLPWFGTHGVIHWARVYENGIRLAETTGAEAQVVTLFALFHDSKRINESIDPGHGQRGAEYAAALRGDIFDLPDELFELLYDACAHHTDGHTNADITVQTCWDADRLDLARAGIQPKARRLCTPAAKDSELIQWANQRSLSNFAPEFLYNEWLPNHEG